MLFNATQSEELRVATINENKLEDLDFERGNQTVEQRSDGGVCGELGGRGEGEGVHGVVRYFE